MESTRDLNYLKLSILSMVMSYLELEDLIQIKSINKRLLKSCQDFLINNNFDEISYTNYKRAIFKFHIKTKVILKPQIILNKPSF